MTCELSRKLEAEYKSKLISTNKELMQQYHAEYKENNKERITEYHKKYNIRRNKKKSHVIRDKSHEINKIDDDELIFRLDD